MTYDQKHPITPPPELVQQWHDQCHKSHDPFLIHIANCAAQWGADQELEACCEWVETDLYSGYGIPHEQLRTARRPNPPSLKEQALSELYLTEDSNGAELSKTQVELIRRALEALPDDLR